MSGKNTLTYLLGVSVGDEKEKLFNQQIVNVFYWVKCTNKYSAHLNFTMIFGKKSFFYCSRIISKELIIASLFIIKAILSPCLSYLPCIVHREYFSIIFNVKKCTLYLIKYGNCTKLFYSLQMRLQWTNTLAYLPWLSVRKKHQNINVWCHCCKTVFLRQ